MDNQWNSATKTLRWVRGIRTKVESLKANPKRCPVDPDSDAFGEEVRVLLHGKRHGKYRILFAIRDDAVHIWTVRHSARRSLAEELGQDEIEGKEGPLH